MVRTFTATDDAGNSSSATQTITVQDTTAPEFSFVPADYAVECSDEMPMDDAVAYDNCGEVTIEVSSETTAGDAAGNYTIVRTFTATDDAGNSASATQTITVQDTTAPEFTFVPADYTVECSDEMPMDDAVASDNCGEVTIEVSSETTAGDAAGNYVIVRTFTATDDAGNSASARRRSPSAPPLRSSPSFLPTTPRVLDEMSMDDAVADNCGEVTIEGRGNHAGDAAGNYDCSHLHGHRRRRKQRFCHQTITSRTPPLLSSPSSPPTTPSSATTRCRWTTPQRGQLRRGNHRSVERNDRWRCRGQLPMVRTFTAPTTLETAALLPSHHGARHHRS